MSKTPSKDVDSLNYLTPKEIISPNKNTSGVSKTVYTHLSRLHSLLNDWISLKEKGVKLCKSISALKLYECVDNYFPHQTKTLTESLLAAVNGLEDIIQSVEMIKNQMKALSQLESTPEAIINTWSCTEITEAVSDISNMLQNEFRLKKVITENIAHCRDECLLEVYVSAWEFEAYFNMDASSYLFAEKLIKACLRRLGLEQHLTWIIIRSFIEQCSNIKDNVFSSLFVIENQIDLKTVNSLK